MPSYEELAALPAEAYLDPSNFLTPFDGPGNAEYRRKQYEKGLEYGKQGDIHIAINSVWSVDITTGPTWRQGSISSSEGIGYHAGTAALLQGFLDSGGRIFVHRWEPESISGLLGEGSVVTYQIAGPP